MASQAKVIIKGQNDIGAAVKSASQDLGAMKAAADKLGAALKSAFAVTAIIASVKKLGDTLVGCFNDFEDANRKYRQMSIALGGGQEFEKVKDTVAALSRQTLEGKDSIESMVAELAALGKNSDEINRISSAAVYLSNVTGKDLNSSMSTLLNTYNGTTTQLKRLGIDVSGFTKTELESGAAVDRVIESLGVYSQELASIDSRQHVTNIKNAWGDIRQSVGDLVNFSFAPMLENFDETITAVQKDFDQKIQNMKIVLANFPEFISRLGETISSIVLRFFSYENIKNIFSWIASNIPVLIEHYLKLISDRIDLYLNAIPESIFSLADGVFNYLMYLVTSWCNETGLNISSLVNEVGKWLTTSGIGKVIDRIISAAVNGVRLLGTLIKNIPQMIRIVADNIVPIISSICTTAKNLFFRTLSALFSTIGTSISDLAIGQKIEDIRTQMINAMGHVGAWFRAIGLTGKDTFRYIGEIIGATFSWDNMKNIIDTMFSNIGLIASATISAIFKGIPSMISDVFNGIAKWLQYMATSLKNTILQAIQNAIQEAGQNIQGTWVGKIFGLGDRLATIDLGIDTRKAEELKALAASSFANVGSTYEASIQKAVDAARTVKENTEALGNIYSGIKEIQSYSADYTDREARTVTSILGPKLESISTLLESRIDEGSTDWKDISEQFGTLLDPVFEKYRSGADASIGQMLASWKAMSSDEYLEESKKSFMSIGDIMKEWGEQTLGDGTEAFTDLWNSISGSVQNLFGDDMDSFSTWFGSFLSDNTEKVADALDGAGKAAGKLEKTLKDATFLDRVGEKLGSIMAKFTGSSAEHGSAFGKSIISNLTSSLGEAGSKIQGLASNMATMGPALGAIATALQYVIEGFGQILSGTLDEILEYGLEPLRELGRVLGAVVLPILEALSPMLDGISNASKILFNTVGNSILPLTRAISGVLKIFEPIIETLLEAVSVLGGLFQAVGQIMETTLGPILTVISEILKTHLAPAVSLFSTVLEILSPVLQTFSKAVITVTGTIQYVCQTFHHWVASFMNALAGISVLGYHPFRKLKMDDPGNPGSYQSYIQGKWNAIESAYAGLSTVTGTAITGGTATSTAVSSAGYQGAQQVTINIYQEAPIVGDGGMRTFARMIKAQFDELDYYGV